MNRHGFLLTVPLVAAAAFAMGILSGCTTRPPVDPQIVAAVATHNVASRTAGKIQMGQSLDYRDILHLVRAKMPTATIIAYLQSTEKSYQFTPGQLDTLRNLGASLQLIHYLNESKGFYTINGTSCSSTQLNLQPFRKKGRPSLPQTQISLGEEVADPAYEESLFSPFYLRPNKF